MAADWRSAGLRFYSRNYYCAKRFGCRVWRISLDARFGCPNRDGTLGTGGCLFCNPASFSPSLRSEPASIPDQLAAGLRQVRARHRVDRFLAYFQPGTNTYAPVEELRLVYQAAIEHPQVVGVVIGTRPDAVPDPVLDLLADLSSQTWLLVEYGLQSVHDRSLDWLRRGHHYDAFLDACSRSRQRGLSIGAHVILGIPGESIGDMLQTARELARLHIDSVKVHNLCAVRDTALVALVARGEVRLPDMAEYVGWVVDFLEELSPGCVIDRLVGDAPRQYLVGPSWCQNKSAVLAAIDAELRRRDTWQGRKRSP